MIDLFRIATQDMLVFSLVFFRMGSLIITMPFFGGSQLMQQARIALVLALTFIVYKQVDPALIPMPGSIIEYVIFIIKESFVGIVIGFIASIAFQAIDFGSTILSTQLHFQKDIGLDPLSESNTNALEQLFSLLIMTVFLLCNGHHIVLKAFIDSYRIVPVSHVQYTEGMFQFAIQTFNLVLAVGMRMAMPVLVMIFTITVSLGFTARLVPQMNVFVLSMPAHIAGGLVVTAVCVPMVAILFRDTFNRVIDAVYKTIMYM